MKKEVTAAGNFLVDLLRLNGSSIAEDQLTKFNKHVCECLWGHYKGHWFPEKPLKGSGYRCIRINGKMDPLIAEAGAHLGMTSKSLRTYFPSELTMWIDPREVSYRIGENGSICVLYSAAKTEHKAALQETKEVLTPNQKLLPPSQTPTKSPTEQQHHHPSSSPQLTPLQHKQLHHPQSRFTPSKLSTSPPPPPFIQSPPAPNNRQSPILTNLSHPPLTLQQQQQLLFLMNSNQSGNHCKDALRNHHHLDAVRGVERLFVSS